MSWVSPTGSMEEKIFHFSRWISWSVTPLVCILGPRAPSPNGGGGAGRGAWGPTRGISPRGTRLPNHNPTHWSVPEADSTPVGGGGGG